MKYITIILITLFLFSCSSTETVTKDKRIEITIPGIESKLNEVEYSAVLDPESWTTYKEIVNTVLDSVANISAIKNIESDESKPARNIKVTYYPKANYFTVNVDPGKVDTMITDTTKMRKKVSFKEELNYYAIGAFIGGSLIIVLIIVLKLKKII